MAFIGIFVLFLILLAAMLATFVIFGVLPIVIGTHLYKKTEHKKAGVVLRIMGYFFIFPSLVISGVLIWVMLIAPRLG